jgi:hypothetical protein
VEGRTRRFDASGAVPMRLIRALEKGERLLDSLRALAASATLVWLAVAVGVALRVARYLADRSLWGDEGALALNIVNKPARTLLEPLDYLQGAPIGFLLVERALVSALGDRELVLRLFPLLCGLLALVVFAVIARRLLVPEAAAIAVILFATVEPLVYYSAEVKQYSTDVVAAVLLLYAVIAVDWNRARGRTLVPLVLAGAALVWFSHPALIAVATLWAAVVAGSWLGRGRAAVGPIAIVGAAWGVSALTSYVVHDNNAREVEALALASSPEAGFAPADLAASVWDSFGDPVGVASSTTGLALVASVAGLLTLDRRDRQAALFLAVPIAGTLTAALLGLYPFSGRFVLFLVPFVLLMLGAGLWAIASAIAVRLPLVAILAVGLLLSYPTLTAAKNAVSPPGHEEVRSVVRYLDERWRDGDAVYVWFQSQYPFRYYAECRDCDALSETGVASAIWPRNPDDARGASALTTRQPLYVGQRSHDLSTYVEDFEQLRGKSRVWLLFSSTWDDAFVRQRLGCLGRRLDEAHDVRASVYLYDLSAPPEDFPPC